VRSIAVVVCVCGYVLLIACAAVIICALLIAMALP
jgi:hypothetical protein